MIANPDEVERPFQLSTSGGSRDGTAIAISGELDLATAPELDDALTRAIDAGGEVRLDFEHCTFIDSTGIATIVRSARRLVTEGGRRLVIARLRSQPQKVLRIAGLWDSGLIAIESSAGDDPGA